VSKRLVNVAKEVNKDVKSLVKILDDHGVYIVPKPTSMVSEEMEKILYKALNLEYKPGLILQKQDQHNSEQIIGFKPIEQVSKELKITRKAIVGILAKANIHIFKSGNVILSPKQIDIIIQSRLDYQNSIISKTTDTSPQNIANIKTKSPAENHLLTKRALRKIRKKEEIARREKEEIEVFKLRGQLKSLTSKNPRGHRGFLGDLWPVKK